MTDPIPSLPQGVLLPPVPTLNHKIKREKKRLSGVPIAAKEEGSSKKKEYRYRPKQTTRPYRERAYSDTVQLPPPIQLPGPNEDIVNYDRAVK